MADFIQFRSEAGQRIAFEVPQPSREFLPTELTHVFRVQSPGEDQDLEINSQGFASDITYFEFIRG